MTPFQPSTGNELSWLTQRPPLNLSRWHFKFVCRTALRRAWTQLGATHELWDSRDRHLITARCSRHIAENSFVRVIPVDAVSTSTVRADGIGSSRRHRRQCRTPACPQSSREHWRERIAPPACRGPSQVAERQGVRVLPGRWLARHLDHSDWTFRNGAHRAHSLHVGSYPDLSPIRVGPGSQDHPGALGSSGAGPWGGSAPTRRGGYRDLTS
jgi:hypothetical protein